MLRYVLLTLIVLSACGRPLSVGETAFAETLFGTELETDKVRIAPFKALTSLTQQRPLRPRVACRELIWPEPETTGGMVKTFTAAFVTYNRINMADALYHPDYMSKYPNKISLPAAMLIGHELTHVWQWQNRGKTGYTPLKAASEHHPGTDPYLLQIKPQTAFLDFPYEQQGAIIEEYICCRSLNPNGARTRRLHALLSEAMPVQALSHTLPQTEIILPWDGVKTGNICN